MTTKTLQMRRGTTAEHLTFTGSEGEITVDTSKQTAVVHNGVNAGGVSMAREDLSNVKSEALASLGAVKTDLSNLDAAAFDTIAKADLSNVSPGAFLPFQLAKNDLIDAKKASEDAQGAIQLATSDEAIAGNNLEKAITPNVLQKYMNSFYTLNPELKPALPLGYIKGLLPSNGFDNPLKDITISEGACRDSSNYLDIILKTTLTKKLDSAWNEGNNEGGLPASLTPVAGESYHLFLIAKIDGSVDAGFDTSINAENLLAETSANGYTYYRYVSSFILDANADFVDFTANEKGVGELVIRYNSEIHYPTFSMGVQGNFELFVPKKIIAGVGGVINNYGGNNNVYDLNTGAVVSSQNTGVGQTYIRASYCFSADVIRTNLLGLIGLEGNFMEIVLNSYVLNR